MIANGEGWTLIHGDCLQVLPTLEAGSVDAVITDPPYELAFMGKAWDRQGVAYNVDLWREVLRVLKPGGHLLAFGGTRTYHRMTVAIEDAGFEIRDCIQWLYGSGFPKSHNISKAIDKAAGAERESIAPLVAPAGNKGRTVALGGSWQENPMLTAPATPEAQRWEGFGTSLKPSHEPIVLARKPLAEPTIAAQVLATGTGALNIEVTRVGTGEAPQTRPNGKTAEAAVFSTSHNASTMHKRTEDWQSSPAGRWPSNLVLSHSVGCVKVGRKRVQGNGDPDRFRGYNKFKGTHYADDEYSLNMPNGKAGEYADADGMEEVDAWECGDGCPVKALDEQAGVSKSRAAHRGRGYSSNGSNEGWKSQAHEGYDSTVRGHNDEGGASRFFPVFAYEQDDFVPWLYCAKASRREREAGLEDLRAAPSTVNLRQAGVLPPAASELLVRNTHPCVKPLTLMSWLCRLVTPPGGVVLDPFTGSGSTGCAALREGFRFIGVEREAEYIEIARRRLEYTLSQRPAVTQARLAV